MALLINWRKSCNIGTSILFVKMRPFLPNLPSALVSKHASRYGAALVHGCPGLVHLRWLALSCNLVSVGIVHKMKGSLHWKAKRTCSLQHDSAPLRNRSTSSLGQTLLFYFGGPSHCCDSASTTLYTRLTGHSFGHPVLQSL